jgi:hypothetical protein
MKGLKNERRLSKTPVFFIKRSLSPDPLLCLQEGIWQLKA